MVSKEKTTLDNVNALIRQGESIRLEFKTSTAKLHGIFETICAFLNGNGGTVLIGVKNNGEITGQDVTDNTRLEIANVLSKVEPPTSLDIDYIPIEKNKFIIKMDAVSNRTLVPFVLLKEAEHFLMRNISIASEFITGKMERRDIPDYPPRAVREAMDRTSRLFHSRWFN
jgi:predicted HTH transcriptional regulator